MSTLFNTSNSLPDMNARTERSQVFLRDALDGTRFANVRWVAETGSTNADLLAAADRGEGEQVLIADLQTAGRGRRDRVWDAPPESGLLMSALEVAQRSVDW